MSQHGRPRSPQVGAITQTPEVHRTPAVQALPAQPGLDQMQQELAALRTLTLATLWMSALVFAVLHGLVVWQLCKPVVRAEFGMLRSPR